MKKKFWIEVYKFENKWSWSIFTINGKGRLHAVSWYKNRTQCRNAAKSFAQYTGLEIREEKR